MAHAGGRPPKFKTPLEMQVIIDQYFRECEPHMEEVEEWVEARDTSGNLKKDMHGLNYLVKVKHRCMTKRQPYTMAGLALRLGMDRRALVGYKDKTEFLPTIMAARQHVEEYNEQLLLDGKATVGAMFNLKVNFGYHEAPEDNPPPINPIVFVNNVPVTPQDKES